MKKEVKLGLIINLIFMVMISLSTNIFLNLKVDPYYTKSTTSVLFVLCGLFNLIYCWKNRDKQSVMYSCFMAVGLALACVGDILLIDYFLFGAIFFALGHVFFLVSFFLLEKFKWRDLVIGAGIFVCALLVILLYPYFEFDGMLILIIVYALIISIMLGKAVSNAFSKANYFRNIIIAIGALLFFLSDLMLLFYVFGGAPKICDIICVGLYYPAEFILAFSIMLVSYLKPPSAETIE